jgi:hypothetical protein
MQITTVKKFLMLLHKLNKELDVVATIGQNLLVKINDIDFTSITDVSNGEELSELFEETGERFRKVNDMKQTLLYGLQRRVIRELDEEPMSSKVKSLSIKRKSKSRTRRAKSI